MKRFHNDKHSWVMDINLGKLVKDNKKHEIIMQYWKGVLTHFKILNILTF